MFDLIKDVNEFKRRLRLQDFFKDETSINTTNVIDRFHLKSDFLPPKGHNIELDNIISILDNQFNSLVNDEQHFHTHKNISKHESKALKELQNKHHLLFTEADKGGALVILDYNFYSSRIREEHLHDNKLYTKVDSYKSQNTLTQIRLLCNNYKNIFTKKEFDYLTKFRYKLPFMYGLPKLHKCPDYFLDTHIDNFGFLSKIAPSDLKFRPIISSRFAPTSHLSAFLDDLLKPLVPLLSSHCRDTFHFLETLPKTVDNDSTLTTFDVTSLYTNIPHDLGYQAIEYWIDIHKDKIPAKFTKDFIMNSLKMILENNFFSFEDNIYLQISGTAMGTKVAPTYASLVMGYLEEKLYSNIIHTFPLTANFINSSWLRYLDDCWIIWKKNYGDFTLFEEILNNLHPAIKFTKEMNNTSLNFLDVAVYIENSQNENTIQTDIYRKKTDSMSYVPFNSAHARHILRNIPFSLAYRIKRIVSDPNIRHNRYEELKHKLLQLKYPINLIDNAIIRAENRTETATTDNDNDHDTLMPFTQTFNKNNPDVFNKIIKPISQTLKLMNSFTNCRFKSTFRQPRSLLSLLSHKHRETIIGVSRCQEQLCKCCELLIVGDQITYKKGNTEKTFNIKCNFNCLSSNLIYFLKCGGCTQYYIGQTGDTLRHRMTVHRQQIHNSVYSFMNVSKHIATCGNKKFFVAPLYQLHPSASRLDREAKESMFISFFSPTLNSN
jgi:hypothetical protein